MKIQLFIFSIIGALIFCTCKNRQGPKERDDHKNCVYEKLQNEEGTRVETNSKDNVNKIRITLSNNLKKLLPIELGGEIQNEYRYISAKLDSIISKELYSEDFLQRHNAIVQILCDIEKDLNRYEFDSVKVEKLLADKGSKRDLYFNFLLDFGKNTDDSTEVPGQETERKENKSNNQNFEKLVSIQLNDQSKGFSKILIDGELISPENSSTRLNPRILLSNYQINNSNVLQIITLKGDTCNVKISPQLLKDKSNRIIPTCA